MVVAHYLRSVSKKVALGAELAYQFGPHVPGNEIALLSLAGRYDGEILQSYIVFFVIKIWYFLTYQQCFFRC